MGTGALATDLFEENFGVKKSFLHWTSNIPSYIMSGQTHNAHYYLKSALGDRYSRFQVYLENDIQMDAPGYVTDLLDLTTEYIEENADQINKVVELLMEK